MNETKLTSALEDYLETIYELVRDQKFARVKDIAKARGVRSASVTPAMRRLAELGYIKYVQREYIDLTPQGEREGRRILARHQLLTRFFEDILQMTHVSAEQDACAMEHSLSSEGMEHLARFFEFLQICPQGRSFLDQFHKCSAVHNDVEKCKIPCKRLAGEETGPRPGRRSTTIAQLKGGQAARVIQVGGDGEVRQRLLDMGVLPNVKIEVERVPPPGDTFQIMLQGFQLTLTRQEAESISASISVEG